MTTTDPSQRITVELPEGPLSVLTAGERGSPVLLLSGGGLDSAQLSWRHLLPDLAADHRVFAPDWPKQGRSRPWNGLADHAALMEVLDRLTDHFDLERTHLVGLSQGAALALARAAAAPERVGRVVAIAPAGITPYPPVVHQLLWLTARSRLLNTTLPTRLMRERSQVEALARRTLFGGPVADFDEVVEEIRAEALENGAGASDWMNTSVRAWGPAVDLRPLLDTITSPTLFLQGDQDPAVPARSTIAAARRLPGAHLRMLRGHRHWPNRQSPGLVNGLVRDFLTQDAPGAGPGTRTESPV